MGEAKGTNYHIFFDYLLTVTVSGRLDDTKVSISMSNALYRTVPFPSAPYYALDPKVCMVVLSSRHENTSSKLLMHPYSREVISKCTMLKCF